MALPRLCVADLSRRLNRPPGPRLAERIYEEECAAVAFYSNRAPPFQTDLAFSCIFFPSGALPTFFLPTGPSQIGIVLNAAGAFSLFPSLFPNRPPPPPPLAFPFFFCLCVGLQTEVGGLGRVGGTTGSINGRRLGGEREGGGLGRDRME